MKKTTNKVALIGSGAVGTSFLYAAINQGIASEYLLIDAFPNASEGNALDLADAAAVLPTPFSSVKATQDYSELKDVDVIVITAGRARKPGSTETRLDMVAGNAAIIREIANNVKKSGFNGITVIASNPVDIITLVYQETTGFDPHKVVGAGTTLDSSRLRRLIGEKVGVAPSSVNAFLIGEHGDSSVAVWSHANIMNQPIQKFVENGTITQSELDNFKQEATTMGRKIIEFKKATFYGIGAALTRIVKAVLNDEKTTLMVGAKLTGQYNHQGLYVGVPAIVSKNGWDEIIEWELSAEEQVLFDQSYEQLMIAYGASRIDKNIEQTSKETN